MREQVIAGAVGTALLVCATGATAQVGPPPPPPPPSLSSGNQDAPKGKRGGAGKAIVIGQIIANGCATLSLAYKAKQLEYRVVTKRVKGKHVRVRVPRELTPLEAAKLAARCGSYAGLIVYGISKAVGLKDTACNIAVAAKAYAVNNTRLAIEQRMFGRDGSDPTWQRTQNLLHAKQVKCYVNGRRVRVR